MAVDSQIAMQGAQTPVQTGPIINDAVNQQNQNAMQSEQILKAHYDNMDEREKQRLTSTIVGAAQLKPYLDKGDLEGAQQFLVNRRNRLQARMGQGENVDTQETDYALDQLRRGNVDGLKNDVASMMAAGQTFGVLSGHGAPSSVQEWQYYNSLSPQDQTKYLTMKRSDKTIDLGGSIIQPNQANPAGAPTTTYNKTLAPADQPANAFAKSKATEQGKASAENQQNANATQDIIGLYGKLHEDAKTAPSGVLQSGAARVSNALNMPSDAAVAQGKFDADLNNLYLATIRSLKGTGRVMEQELVKIAEAAPKPEDSMEVKMAKAEEHMRYYKERMRSLGYDPETGQPTGQGVDNVMPAPAGSAGGAPAAVGATGGQKIRVTKGRESYLIDPNDLQAAQQEGFVVHQ